jgi:molybdopterin-guanine dinucleotide biosynthesis protein A
MTIELPAVILAGGRGRRFRVDKASAEIGGRYISWSEEG